MENEEVLFQKVKKALGTFFEQDHALLNVNASERSISHKLAEHLQKQFPDLNVDCEYNRHGDVIKTLYTKCDSPVAPDALEAKTVFPDIIIHKRGNDEMNLLVIEIKKINSGRNHIWDIEKLRAFTSKQYRYEVGLFLLFDVKVKRIGNVQHFKKGEEMISSCWIKLKELGYGG